VIYAQETEEITEWFISFHASCRSRFWARATPGKFKHVRAFAWSSGVRAWVFYDVWLFGGTRITLAPGGPIGDKAVGEFVSGASVLKLSRLPDRKPSLRMRVGFWCVTAVRHLVNLPGGALLPDALWRDCLRNGAQVIIDGRSSPGA
jgi:hypothetical protein